MIVGDDVRTVLFEARTSQWAGLCYANQKLICAPKAFALSHPQRLGDRHRLSVRRHDSDVGGGELAPGRSHRVFELVPVDWLV